jgi:hypothetical protein
LNGSGDTAAARRVRLLTTVAAQRATLAAQWQGVLPALNLADRGVSAVRTVARHPLLVVVAVAALALWRPRRTLQVLQYGAMAWQMVRRFSAADSKNNK